MLFLNNTEFSARPFNLNIENITPVGLFLGCGRQGLEIVVFTIAKKPISGLLQQAFKDRKGGRASPILVVALYPDGVSLCGTNGEQPPIVHSKDVNQIELLCEAALKCPDRNIAIRFLADAMPAFETPLPGISNKGLLSLHELIHGTRNRPDWLNASQSAKKVLGKSNHEMITALGFQSHPLDNLTEILSVGDERTAIAVLLKEHELEEVGIDRFNNISPISYALAKADKQKLPWVIMIQEQKIRLYNTKNIGVSGRGRTETYIECHPSLMSSDTVALLWLLFSSEAIKEGGTINSILEESKRFAASIAEKLRDRIYDIVVPELSIGIVKEQNINNPSKKELNLTYEMALTVLFRLLFIAYSEDRDLLPSKTNESYRKRSLKQKAFELSNVASKNIPISEGNHHWTETIQLWEAISNGNTEWGVPAYAGTIFSSDNNISPAGAALAKINLPNKFFEKALRALLLTKSSESLFAPVDFRSLSVREFGTIYEGLLESELSIAMEDLTRDRDGNYIPASSSDNIFKNAKEVYLHNKSGARKASGSYYTPDFAVEHLLNNSLIPALDEHLKRMEQLNEADRAEQFFNFSIADISMGSGHFLVAAIDKVEQRFSYWLEENPNPGINRELQFLKNAARTQLGDLADTVVLEDGQLLRRMIARRCIYGVDLNPIAVQLARLSIWIHCFVPGLPLSLLDHNLIQGNALVGVGSLDEIRKKFDEGAGTLFEVDADNLLGQAAEPLLKLARLSEGSIKDIEAGRALMEEARLKTLETKALCDIITAQPVSEDPRLKGFNFQNWENMKNEIHRSSELTLARQILNPLSAMHFPIAFPEVFLGRSQGFNVILGNPPWQELTVEEDAFWARYYPGLGGMTQRDQEEAKKEYRLSRPDLVLEYDKELKEAKIMRNFLVSNYEGMGKGDPDLYKAFCNRFIKLNGNQRTSLGVVLPRSAFSSAGSEYFRKQLVRSYTKLRVTILKNTKKWVFKDVSEQYTFALLNSLKTNLNKNTIELKGPYSFLKELEENDKKPGVIFNSSDLEKWTDTWSFPALSEQLSAKVFLQMRKSPRLDKKYDDEWRVRPDTELHATAQKPLMDLKSETCPDFFWPVYKGKSFNLWEPDKEAYYAWANPKNVFEWLQKKRLRAQKSSRKSVHKEFSLEYVLNEKTLPPNRPRIVFRDISRATDPRTIIACLIPSKRFLTNKAPFLHFPKGDELDEAYVLGVLSSIPLDWYARKFVELNVNLFIFNPLPIPRPNRGNSFWKRLVELSGRLACPDERFAEWAKVVGVDYGPLSQDEKNDKIYELDAIVAHLYGLSELQLVHIFENFHPKWDYELRLIEVLKHYQAWKGKV